MVSISNVTLGGGVRLEQIIHKLLYDTLSQWSGQELAAVSVYGIRVYHEGAVLATHVDRLPRVLSAILNVDQDGTWMYDVRWLLAR